MKNLLPNILLFFSSIYSLSCFADGFIDEVLSLNNETKGCVSSTHTSFRNKEDLANCTNVDLDQLSKLNSIKDSLTQLSRYTYLSDQADDYLKKLSQKYKEIYPLHQNLSFNGPSTSFIETEKRDILENLELLHTIEQHIHDEKKLLQELKCHDPKMGDWKERYKICTDLKEKNNSLTLNAIKANIYSRYPFLFHPQINAILNMRDFPKDSLSLLKPLKMAVNDHVKTISNEISTLKGLKNNSALLSKFSSPKPGPNSQLTNEQWELLERIISNGRVSKTKGFERYIYVDCLFHEDFINHEKLIGVDLFKKNMAISALSLGMGAVAARYGSFVKILGTVTPTAIGVAFIDLPEIKKLKLKCEALEKNIAINITNAQEWQSKNQEIQSCETNLRLGVLIAAMGPATDVVAIAGPVLKKLNLTINTNDFSKRISNLKTHKTQTNSIPAVQIKTPPPPIKSKMITYDQYSRLFQDQLDSPQKLAARYSISIEQAKQIVERRKMEGERIFKKITSSKYLDEDLTQLGYTKYDSLQHYQKSKSQTQESLTTTDLMQTTKYYFNNIKNGPEIYEAMYKAMHDRSSMIQWHNDMYDDLMHRLLESKNSDWLKSFEKSNQFPRELVEEAMLERASMFGWPKSFMDLDGGVLSGKDFGKKVASGHYLRERDLDQAATKAASSGKIGDELLTKKILSGELKHGELTHAAHMDYMLYMAQKGKLGPLKPEELRGFIKKIGEGLQLNLPGLQNAWTTLFDGTAQGKTLATPNNFYDVFGTTLNL